MKCNTAVGDNDEPSGYGFRLRRDESGRILLLGDSADTALAASNQGIMLACVFRLGSVFPLDVAAYAGFLFDGNPFSFENGIERGSQIRSGYGDAVSRPAVVH